MKKNHLELLWVMAKTDFKLRYHGSVLGYFWSLLKPLMLFAVLWLVFSVFMRWDAPHYQLQLLLGIILWSFFAEASMAGVYALAGKANIIKKIYFPRILVVLASTITAFLSLFINCIIFGTFAYFSNVRFSPQMIIFILIVIIFYIMILGLSLLLSSIYIKLRDMNQIWEVVLQVGFWLTPIVYPLGMVPEKFRSYLFLNPLTGIIQFSREAVIERILPSFSDILYIAIWSVGLFMVGFIMFYKLSPYAAEEL